MLCTDADLLRWEPSLADECAAVAQSLYEGPAAFDRATLALVPTDAAGFARAGAIAVVDGACFAIARVDAESAAPASARVVRLAVRTFAAQRRIVADQLGRLARRDVAAAALRHAAALGTLHLIYAAMLAAAAPGAEADAAVRCELYLRLYRKSLRGVVVGFDAEDDDGETRRPGRPPQGFAPC